MQKCHISYCPSQGQYLIRQKKNPKLSKPKTGNGVKLFLCIRRCHKFSPSHHGKSHSQGSAHTRKASWIEEKINSLSLHMCGIKSTAKLSDDPRQTSIPVTSLSCKTIPEVLQ